MRIEIVHKDGHSFREAHTYLAHDKAANTNDRVAWVETVNLATNDPEQAWRVMAATAMDAPRLKQQAGVPPQGQKGGGPVMHLYIAWRPDEVEGLTREAAVREAKGALAKLGKDTTHSKKVKHGYRFYGDELQAVIYRHTDTDHPHVHVLVNRVHPTHGRTLNDSYDHLKLSRYADKFEERNGRLVTPQRRLNNEARDRGEYVKHKRKRGRGQYELEQAVGPEAAAAKLALIAKQTQRAAAIARRQREARAAHQQAVETLEAQRREGISALRDLYREKQVRIEKERKRRTGAGVQQVRDAYRPRHEAEYHELQARLARFRQNEQRAVGRALNALRAIDFAALVKRTREASDGRAATFREAFTIISSSGAREQAILKAYERERDALRQRQKAEEAAVRVAEKRRAEAAEKLRRAQQRLQESNQRRQFAERREAILNENRANRDALQDAWKEHERLRRREWRELAREHPAPDRRADREVDPARRTQPGDLVGGPDTPNAARVIDSEKARRETLRRQIDAAMRSRDRAGPDRGDRGGDRGDRSR